MVHRFDPAPWPLVLKLASGLGTLLTLGLAAVFATQVPHAELDVAWGLVVSLLVAMPVVAWLMRVRGYEVEGSELRVLRPIGPVRRSLRGLGKVETGRQVLEASVRTFGNGGFFAFSGWYWSRAKGPMRLWVTDPYRPVLLVLDGKSVVVSPADTEGFVRTVKAAAAA